MPDLRQPLHGSLWQVCAAMISAAFPPTLPEPPAEVCCQSHLIAVISVYTEIRALPEIPLSSENDRKK